MRQKKTVQQLAWFLTLLSFSAIILYPAGLLYPMLLFPLLFLAMPSRNLFLASCIIVSLTCFHLAKVNNASILFCGVPLDCITSITGKAVYDSSFTQSKNNLITIYVNQVESIYGQTVSAKGLVNVITDDKAIITSGVTVTYCGKFSEEFFKGTSFQILSRSRINDLREFFISEVEKRVLSENNSSSYLSTMLLLGRIEDSAIKIKESAKACGCTHVLALSGMHLNTLALLFKPLKNKKLKYVLTVFAALAFVFIAGPRPSLVRALLMLIFIFLPIEERLLVSYIVQLTILPFSMVNTGCIYSYLAIIALIFIAPILKELLPVLKPIVTSASVIFLIAPLELLTTKCWHPIAILIGPIAGFLVSISMVIGLFLLFFGQLKPITWTNNLVYTLLEKLFSKYEYLPEFGWKSYAVFAAIFTLLLMYIPLKKQLLRHRFKKFNKNPIIKL